MGEVTESGRVPLAPGSCEPDPQAVPALTGFDPSRGHAMDIAPKDRPILAWCLPECADPNCAYSDNSLGGCTSLCLYHAHAEGMSAYGLGFCVIEWGGSWNDATWEEPNAGWMPDWWFRFGSEFEEAANPVRWWPLPAIAMETRQGEDGTAPSQSDDSAGRNGIAQGPAA